LETVVKSFGSPDIAISELPTSGAVLRPPSVQLPARDADALDHLGALPTALALLRAVQVVRHLAAEYTELLAPAASAAGPPGSGGGPQVVHHSEGRAAAWWLGYFFWPPGAATPIHDHTSWGVYACAGGTLLEARYRRLDDGAQPNRAHLRLRWERRWTRGDCSALRPYAGGIHRLANPGAAPAWSVHLYGPRLGPFDGRDYDPARDYVCDRPQ
jgi:predicted metal-dependent enzyme (double-stranded beta helix superfamily)